MLNKMNGICSNPYLVIRTIDRTSYSRALPATSFVNCFVSYKIFVILHVKLTLPCIFTKILHRGFLIVACLQ